jgi:tetratricopeptide (TPR) repeat protein
MKLIRRSACPRVLALVAAVVLVIAEVGSAGQEAPPTFRQLFESGRYPEMADRATAQGEGSLEPGDAYLLAHAYQKLHNLDAARSTLAQLGMRGDTDPWSLIARAEQSRLDQNLDQALSLAQTAVTQAAAPDAAPPAAAYAYYELGAVYSQRQDMPAAADAFEKASAADPTFAYAHYYAGMAYSRLQQIDRVASHFETFLTLAPEAPERGVVESLMRTIRGK